MSAQWNQQLSRYVFSKVIEFLKQNVRKQIDYKRTLIQNKWIEYKIFELKYGNRKLSNVWKYNQVRLVLTVFISIYM